MSQRGMSLVCLLGVLVVLLSACREETGGDANAPRAEAGGTVSLALAFPEPVRLGTPDTTSTSRQASIPTITRLLLQVTEGDLRRLLPPGSAEFTPCANVVDGAFCDILPSLQDNAFTFTLAPSTAVRHFRVEAFVADEVFPRFVGQASTVIQADTTLSMAMEQDLVIVLDLGAQQIDEGVPVSLPIEVSDPEEASLSFAVIILSATGEPQSPTELGLSFDTSTGDLTGTPTNTAASGSPYTVTITALVEGVPVDSTTFLLTVTNPPPEAENQTVTTSEDPPVPVAITLGATDPDGDALTFTIRTPPANGTLSGPPPNVTYTPKANFNGADSFTFLANDGTADSNVAIVSISVTPVNDPPELASIEDPQLVHEGQTLTVPLKATDVDEDMLGFSWVGVNTAEQEQGVGFCTLADNGDGTGSLNCTPGLDDRGNYSITVTVTDDGMPSGDDSQPFTLTVISPPTQLGFDVQPSPTPEEAVITPLVRVAIQDAAGNTVDSATNEVTLALGPGSPPGALLEGTTTMPPVDGIVTFPDLHIDISDVDTSDSPFTFTLIASATGLTPDESDPPFEIIPAFQFAGMVTSAVFDPRDPFTGSIGFGAQITGCVTFEPNTADAITEAHTGSYTMAGTTIGMTVDIGGNPFPVSALLNISVADGISGGSDQYTVVTQQGTPEGLAAFLSIELLLDDPFGTALSSEALPRVPPELSAFVSRAFFLEAVEVDGNETVQFQIRGVVTKLQQGCAFSPQPAALAILGQPSVTPEGAVITPPVEVAIQDAVGNTVDSATNAVTLTLGPGSPEGALLEGTTTVLAENGIATFSDVHIDISDVDTSNSDFTLIASVPGLTTDESDPPFEIIPAFQFAGMVTSAVFDPHDPFTGSIGFGAQITGCVTFQPTTTDAIPAAHTGSYTMQDPRFGITVDIGGNPFPVSALLNISVADGIGGGSDQYTVVAQQGTPEGLAVFLSVELLLDDPFGTALSSDALPRVPPELSAFVSRAFFLEAVEVDGSETVQFQIRGVVTKLQQGCAFSPQPAALAILGQPSVTPEGAVITPPVQVAIQDAAGNTVDSATNAVTLALGPGSPEGVSLGGTTTVVAVGGIATFSDVSIDTSGSPFTLVASVPGLTSATSEAFDIIPAFLQTFQFEGTVTSAVFDPSDPFTGSIGFGAPIMGCITFEPNTGDAIPAAHTGSYTMQDPRFGLTVDIGGNPFPVSALLNISVADGIGVGIDQYTVVARQGRSGELAEFLSIELLLDDPFGTALSSDALPGVPPVLSDFVAREFFLDTIEVGGSETVQVQIRGVVTALQEGCN